MARANRRRPPTRVGLLALVIAAACLHSGCGPAEPDDAVAAPPGLTEAATSLGEEEKAASHRRMVMHLEDIRRRTPDENIWQGDRQARQARQALASLPAGADDRERARREADLGFHELRLGNEREAIELYESAYAHLSPFEDKGSRSKALRHLFRLGVAYLRYGETQNCCKGNTAESCILPLRGSGFHTDPEGSREAIRCFGMVLENAPPRSVMHYKALWLLNIACITLGEYPDGVPERYRVPEQVFLPGEDFPRFENLAPKLGLASFNLFGGVVADDLDNDGHLDIVTSTFDTAGPLHFFHNEGDGTFTDRTQEAGLEGLFGGLNMVQADYDNDGNLDLFVLRGAWLSTAGRHPNSLLHNNGDGSFTDVTFAAGLGDVQYPTQTAAWADYDNDGDVDLYVGNESTTGLDAPCQLFRNNGNGTFTDVAVEAGVDNRTFVKGVIWGDYDGDRYPDLYVSSMSGPNRLYHNNGDGTFADVADELGVVQPIDSFPVWFWDFDNDGVLDLYVPSYEGTAGSVGTVAASYLGKPISNEMPRLYRGDGQARFQEVARDHGLTLFLLPMGANFGDLNNDGYLDFYLGTGYPDYEAIMPNVMYLNRDGAGFDDVTLAGGFGHLQKGHAIAFVDFDNDGDQDIFAQMGGAFPGDRFSDCFYENPGFGNHWVALHLVGVHSNRSAIGARIRVDVVEDGKRRSIYKHVNTGGSFGSNPLRQTIGLGTAAEIVRLEIDWPTTGLTQTFDDVSVDAFYRVIEDSDDLIALDL